MLGAAGGGAARSSAIATRGITRRRPRRTALSCLVRTHSYAVVREIPSTRAASLTVNVNDSDSANSCSFLTTRSGGGRPTALCASAHANEEKEARDPGRESEHHHDKVRRLDGPTGGQQWSSMVILNVCLTTPAPGTLTRPCPTALGREKRANADNRPGGAD